MKYPALTIFRSNLSVSILDICGISSSTLSNSFFVFENVSSIGAKSGEYGGRNINNASIDFLISGTWECGHQMASSGAVCGLVRNYKKRLVPLIVFTSISPATEIHAIADILSPLTRRE